MKIGFVGVPALEKINQLKFQYPDADWFDLDVPAAFVLRKGATNDIPKTTCSIIQTILINTNFIQPDILVAPIGPSKCDSMRFLIPIIKKRLPQTQIIECLNNDSIDFGFPVCTSDLPLIKKIELITSNVLNNKIDTGLKKVEPKAGFWGVPPYDFSILKLFPDETHVFGWTRCMENKTPHNIDLELYIEPGVPTVFFSQAFCPKNILAKELARIHKGLYVETDGLMDSSTKAKITAFLEFKNCYW